MAKPSENLRAQALFMFGVVVALAMTKAIEAVIPHLLTNPIGHLTGESARLSLFLLMVVRYYLGAAVYFAEKCKEKSYGVDLTLGLLHFLVFYVWALTIPILPTAGPDVPPEAFFWFLMLILIYNLGWCAMQAWVAGVKIPRMVIGWTIMNTATALVSIVFWAATTWRFNWNPYDAEKFVAGLVAIVSFADIGGLLQRSSASGGGRLHLWLARLVADDDPDD